MLLDDLRVDWGVNRWVLVERGEQSVQRQMSKPTELATAIRDVAGVSWEDALEEAERLWRKRPADAGARLARGRQSLVAATGLSTRAVFAAVALFVAIWFIVIVALIK
jgi:hypothetical protein